jgi:hypothetical protein
MLILLYSLNSRKREQYTKYGASRNLLQMGILFKIYHLDFGIRSNHTAPSLVLDVRAKVIRNKDWGVTRVSVFSRDSEIISKVADHIDPCIY